MTSPRRRSSGAVRASSLVTVAGGRVPRRGRELDSAKVIRDGVVAWDEGRITYAGPAEGFEGRADERYEESAIVPGFVDCHTHLPFVRWRADEFEARLQGLSYRDLHGEGGIYRSARLLAEASDDEVLAFSLPLAGEMLDHGTTALELKTGYGLSVEGELRQARLARRLGEAIAQTARVTLLACHAVPEGIDRATWVRIACDELIPAAAAEGLADAVDVYVEDIAFSVDDLARVAEAAAANGLPFRCHADQLGPSGAVEAAVGLGARSVDHLNHVSPAGIAALGAAEASVGVLLPTSTLFLGERPPPVGDLLAAGAALAVATDCNPGTSPVVSMPQVISAACTAYGLTPLGALAASTIDPAWVLGIEGEVGSLEPGKRADFLVLDAEDVRMVPYRPGHDPVVHTFIGGERVGGR